MKPLLAQLPSLIQPTLAALSPGPDKRINRQTIEAELVQRLKVELARAGQLVTAVGTTIAQNVSAGQIKDVQRQLPGKLGDVFFEVSLMS